MSTKLTPEVIVKAAAQVGIDKDKRQALIEMLADMVAPDSDEPKEPAIKKQFVILVSDPLGKLAGLDFVGWVLQIAENESPQTAEQRIHRAAYEFNTTKRGRLLPVQTIGEACENVKAKHFKEQEVWVKTKTPVLVCVTNNEIPKTDSVLGEDRGGAKADVETADGSKITRAEMLNEITAKFEDDRTK